MSEANVNEAVARLEQLVQQQQEQLAALSQRQAEVDPVLLAQQRRGVEAALDAPLKSMPEGARAMDFRPFSVRKREMGLAKMQRLAANRGGVWHPSPQAPSVYGHLGLDPQQPWREACPMSGQAEFGPTCQRTCWTPETETRFLYALGLKDLAGDAKLVRLGPDDPVNNKNALLEIVGLLKGSQSTMNDAYGRYPSQDERGEVSADTRRKVAKV